MLSTVAVLGLSLAACAPGSTAPGDLADPGKTPMAVATTSTDTGTTSTDPGTTSTDPGTTSTDPGTTSTDTGVVDAGPIPEADGGNGLPATWECCGQPTPRGCGGSTSSVFVPAGATGVNLCPGSFPKCVICFGGRGCGDPNCR